MGTTKNSPGCGCCGGCSACQNGFAWEATVTLATYNPLTASTITSDPITLTEFFKTSGTDMDLGHYCETEFRHNELSLAWGSECFNIECSPSPKHWISWRWIVNTVRVTVRWFDSGLVKILTVVDSGWTSNSCLSFECDDFATINALCLDDTFAIDEDFFYLSSDAAIGDADDGYYIDLGTINCDEFTISGDTVTDNGSFVAFGSAGPFYYDDDGCTTISAPSSGPTLDYDITLEHV